MVFLSTLSKFLVKKSDSLVICGWKIGIKIKLYFNGQLFEESNYVNNKMHGLCRRWRHTGQLFEESNYANGKMHGLHRK
jgi:hypothetical protein